MMRFMQDQAKDKKIFDDLIKGYEEKAGKPMKDPEKLREVIIGNGYSIEQKSAACNLLLTFKSGLEIAAILETEFQHDLIYAPTGSLFVTCDNPIMTVGPDGSRLANVGLGCGSPNTEVIFPLNKRVCLVLSRGA